LLINPKANNRSPLHLPLPPQVGFSAACFWEYILPNHPNIFQQISGALNLAGWDVTAAAGGSVLALIIFHDVITSALPGSPTFSDENARVGGLSATWN
jgi:hypothetical protein